MNKEDFKKLSREEKIEELKKTMKIVKDMIKLKGLDKIEPVITLNGKDILKRNNYGK